jgi:ArsR family transcriptional regulator
MDARDAIRLNARAGVLKAIAHPARLFIVEELKKGERCVCELTAMIGSDISTVSRHLSVLKNAGIIGDDKRGNQVFYTLKGPCILIFGVCRECYRKECTVESLLFVES